MFKCETLTVVTRVIKVDGEPHHLHGYLVLGVLDEHVRVEPVRIPVNEIKLSLPVRVIIAGYPRALFDNSLDAIRRLACEFGDEMFTLKLENPQFELSAPFSSNILSITTGTCIVEGTLRA